MNDRPTAHKMLAVEQPERNILTDLREILLAAHTDIPSSHVDTTRQRFLTLGNQLGKVNLRGMSYPLLAVLNVVELLKYWHMKYDADDDDSSQTPCSQTESCHSSSAVCNIAPRTTRDVCMFSLIFHLDSLIIMYITLTPILFSPCILFLYFFNVRASL